LSDDAYNDDDDEDEEDERWSGYKIVVMPKKTHRCELEFIIM